MSGGILTLALATGPESGRQIVLLVAGVLVEYDAAPENVLLPSRLDCLADALAPGRPELERTHRAHKWCDGAS